MRISTSTKPLAPVRCMRCHEVIMEAKPTMARVVCHQCLGLSWERCKDCGGRRQYGVCERCFVAPED